jgi:predicted nucleic acid-binding protein
VSGNELGRAAQDYSRSVTLLDTNVLIYASDRGSPFCAWSRETIADAVSSDGAAINAVTLAELCVGVEETETAADRIRQWGVAILDLPAATAEPCARAYRVYRERRRAQSGRDSPAIPLPDFFIGAHAQVMAWHLATFDVDRYQTYFPTVVLDTPFDSD